MDAVEAHRGHAVHVGRQDDSVPMDGCQVAVDGTGGQLVRCAQVHGRPLAPTQDGRGQRAVHGDRRAHAPGEVHRRLTDGQIELGAGQDVGVAGRGPCSLGNTAEAGDYAADDKALHESDAAHLGQSVGWW